MGRTVRRGALDRRHGAPLAADRCELEASGWRTTLDYRENHVRGRDGRLRQLQVIWYAEAEREGVGDDAVPTVVSASAAAVDRVWSRLRAKADVADVSTRRASRRTPADAV